MYDKNPFRQVQEARRYGSAGPVQDHMSKKLYPKLVKSAQSHINSIAGDHVYNGDDWDDNLSHSKNLDRAQEKGMMVPGRDHVVHAHAEIAADHLAKKHGHHPGFSMELAHKASLEAGHNIWGHSETKDSDQWNKYKEIDRKRAAARAAKPPRLPKQPKENLASHDKGGFKTKLGKNRKVLRGTGSYGHHPSTSRYLEEGDVVPFTSKKKDPPKEPSSQGLKVKHAASINHVSWKHPNGNVLHLRHDGESFKLYHGDGTKLINSKNNFPGSSLSHVVSHAHNLAANRLGYKLDVDETPSRKGPKEVKEGRQPRGYHNWNRAETIAHSLRKSYDDKHDEMLAAGYKHIGHDKIKNVHAYRGKDDDVQYVRVKNGKVINLNESFLLEKEQDAKMKAAGYKLIGRTDTKDPNKETKKTTYSVYGKGSRRKIVRTRGGKQVHEERDQ